MKLRSKTKHTDQSLSNAPVEVQVDDKKRPTKRRKATTSTSEDAIKAKKDDPPSTVVAVVVGTVPPPTVVAAAASGGGYNTIDEYIEKIVPSDGGRRNDVRALHQLVTRLAPALDVNIADFKDTIAYGKYQYKYKSGKEGYWYKIGISCGGKQISFHCCGLIEGKYILESYGRHQVGKNCSVGKSCIRFKALHDLNIPTVEKIIVATANSDTMTSM
jgi:hypothetical protein